MKRVSGLLALMAFLGFGLVSPLAFAGEDKDKDEGGKVVNSVIYGDDEKKDEGGKAVNGLVFGDDEKKDEGGK